MRFYNIGNRSEKVTLREAVLKSSKGMTDLYMPEQIPVLRSTFFSDIHNMSLIEISLEVSHSMLGSDIPFSDLEKIVKNAFTFEIPLVQLGEDLNVLELSHGPTLAFKDVGARYLAGILEYLVNYENTAITILAATSGDTGSAVANAFFNRNGIRVVILYPSGKVSRIQEAQLTTMGGNITALEVDGDFDSCQRLVKSAFADTELNGRLNLTSGNSINFGRLFPQSFYYFYAYGQLPASHKGVVFSVPSGNFGNLTAGLLAGKMGLPVERFIAAANSNHSVVDYLQTGVFEPGLTIQTITNAMDVGNPGNFPRILDLFNNSHNDVSSVIKGYWFTDDQTREGMVSLQKDYSYQADPHGAVAFLGLRKYLENNDCTGIFLETAHPSKFLYEVENTTGKKVEIPDSVNRLFSLEKKSVRLDADYAVFREFLSDLI